jgi:hypothetical protein
MVLLEWQYLIFLLPIGFGALYLMLMAFGLCFGESEIDAGGHDVDAEVDHDIGVDHDVALEHDVAVEHDVGADHDISVEHDVGAQAAGATAVDHGDAGVAHLGAFDVLVGFLGVGKVPLTTLLLSYCFIWGGAGLISLTVLKQAPVWTAIVIAAAAANFLTRHLAAGVAWLLPALETYHTPKQHLLGLRGEVLYEVTENSGIVRVVDERHDQRDVHARVAPGAKKIPARTSVVLARYDAATKTFLVEA